MTFVRVGTAFSMRGAGVRTVWGLYRRMRWAFFKEFQYISVLFGFRFDTLLLIPYICFYTKR